MRAELDVYQGKEQDMKEIRAFGELVPSLLSSAQPSVSHLQGWRI